METLKKRFLIASAGFTVTMMLLSPSGSINPSKVGFYTSILAGLFWYFCSYYLFKYILKKYQK